MNPSVANPGVSNVNPVSSEVIDNSGGGNAIVANPVLGNDTPGDAPDTTPGDMGVNTVFPNQAIVNTIPSASGAPEQDVQNITPKPCDVVDKSGSGNLPVANDANTVLGNGMPAVVPDNPVNVNPAVPDLAVANAIPNASDNSRGSGNVPVVNDANPVLGNGTPGDVPVSANVPGNAVVGNSSLKSPDEDENSNISNPGFPNTPTVPDHEKEAIANGTPNIANPGECPESSVKKDAVPNFGDGTPNILNGTPNVPNPDEDAAINDAKELKNEHGKDVKGGDSKGESPESGVVNSTSDECVETKSVQIQRNSKAEDTSSTDAGVREHFVNYLGGKTIIANPIDVIHAKNQILPLYKIYRLHLGINRDTAAAFLSYSKMKAYYHKFQSTGVSERQLSAPQVDRDDEVTIYVKTGSYFYCRTNCPIPDRCIESVESSKQKKEPVSKSTKSKSGKKGQK